MTLLRNWAPVAVFSAMLMGPCLIHHGLAETASVGACLSRTFFGVRCPGCGLTTATHHVLHLRLGAGMEAHPLGVIAVAWAVASFFLSFVLAVPRRVEDRSSRLLSLQGRVHHGFGLLLVVWWTAGIVVGRR